MVSLSRVRGRRLHRGELVLGGRNARQRDRPASRDLPTGRLLLQLRNQRSGRPCHLRRRRNELLRPSTRLPLARIHSGIPISAARTRSANSHQTTPPPRMYSTLVHRRPTHSALAWASESVWALEWTSAW